VHVGDIQLDNCARWIRLFVVSLCWNSHFRPFCGAAKWTPRDFRASEFSTRHPVKFSAPAAGYHFHDLTGGKVNFAGIFSEGRGRKGGACVFFFFRFVFCFGYFHCCSQHECSGVSHVRVSARYIGVCRIRTPWVSRQIEKKIGYRPAVELSIAILLKNTGGGGDGGGDGGGGGRCVRVALRCVAFPVCTRTR